MSLSFEITDRDPIHPENDEISPITLIKTVLIISGFEAVDPFAVNSNSAVKEAKLIIVNVAADDQIMGFHVGEEHPHGYEEPGNFILHHAFGFREPDGTWSYESWREDKDEDISWCGAPWVHPGRHTPFPEFPDQLAAWISAKIGEPVPREPIREFMEAVRRDESRVRAEAFIKMAIAHAGYDYVAEALNNIVIRRVLE